MSLPDLVILIPLSFLAGALVIPVLGDSRSRAGYPIALGTTGIASALAIAGLSSVFVSGPIRYEVGGWMPPIGVELVLDPLSAFLTALVTIVALLVMIHSGPVVRREHPEVTGPFYSSALLLLGGFVGILVTGDLFNLFVFMEVSAIASYGLLAIGGPRSPLSSFRYLILGTVGAAFYLLGLGFIFVMTGTLNMADLGSILPYAIDSPVVFVGLALMTAGVALKMGLFPLHQWLPDAYTHASSSATALIAPIGTKVAAYVLIRIFFYVLGIGQSTHLTIVLGYLGCAAIVWGSVLAIAQTDLKRMLAYSSVGQIGYIAIGIGLASPLGLTGAVLHMLNHAVMKSCLFLVSANFRLRLGDSDIVSLSPEVRRQMPWTAAGFTLAAISMIGLPPTAGFFSKWYLVLGSAEQARWVFAGAILASSLLNAVYFFRIIERIYLGPGSTAATGSGADRHLPVSGDSSGSMLAPTLLLASGVLVLGLFNVWIVNTWIGPMIPADMSQIFG